MAVPKGYIVLAIKSVLVLVVLQIVLDNISGISTLLTQIDAIIKNNNRICTKYNK